VNPETGAVESDGCDWRKPYVPFERRLTPAQRKKLEKEMMVDPLYYADGYKAVVKCDCTCLTPIHPEHDVKGEYYEICKCGLITAKEGYAYDFATGAFDTDSIKRGSLFHDIACQAIREGRLDTKWQAVSDQLLVDICEIDGMRRLRRWWIFRAVRRYQSRRMAEINGKKATLNPEQFRRYLNTLNAHPIKVVPVDMLRGA
jgi:hypothetical protein